MIDKARDLVVKTLKEGGDSLSKFMNFIREQTVPDPKGIIKDAALYCLEEKHEFRTACHYIKEW